jgi:hypothetical protein
MRCSWETQSSTEWKECRHVTKESVFGPVWQTKYRAKKGKIVSGTNQSRFSSKSPTKFMSLSIARRLTRPLHFVRTKSTSPYGRSHIVHLKPPSLPPPCVPEFPQLVIRADGSSYTHYTTSPRSVIHLTRDLTNSPLWNTALWAGRADGELEDEATGRLGRFRRKFDHVDYTNLEAQNETGETEGEIQPEHVP